MNDGDKKWIEELQKASRVRTPVGSAYAIALALMHVAAQLEKLAARDDEDPPAKAMKK